MSFVHSWLSAWLASIVLQEGFSVKEGLACICIDNNMASLMGREATMPANVSARPFLAV